MSIDKKRLMIVDDEPDFITFWKFNLEMWGYDVISASNGQEAVERAKEFTPDLILMDVKMPRMDGFEASQRLKQDFTTANIPIIMLTGEDQTQDKVAGLHSGADDYVIKTVDPDELQARIVALLKRTEERIAVNPLSQLPGNVVIDRMLRDTISKGGRFCVGYCDVDNFKAFNDKYGYKQGDEVIRKTTQILLKAVEKCGNPDDFLGHVGGDDFVFLTTPDKADVICTEVIETFDGIIPNFYKPEDRNTGCIEVKNRRGIVEKFPLMSITIALVTNELKPITSPVQVGEIAAEVKKYLKTLSGSNYMKDRRTDDIFDR